ncbi:RIO1 family-domain-containing protein [Mycena sp. CBHHK59/15]|nr:RIO1 family-domain-containing protein [Mycena sp. CBHHK59/15]
MATILDDDQRIDNDDAASSSDSPLDDLSSLDDWDGSDYDSNRVEDEDWERAEGDFTKHFNRLRQHVAVRTGNAQGTSSALGKNASVVAVPAINHPAKSTAPPRDRTTDQLAALAKFSSRIAKIDIPYTMGVGVNRKGPSSYANQKDKSDRATNEQVLDPRTRIILFKMIGRGLVDEVNGCVSTGKEANVYHALAPDAVHLALKIYKTSILVFKDRDKYVSGEHRFRRGYSRHNPRKMVRLWAEKEMRNLKRLVAAGIRCPEPIEVRENVLVMTFLGDAEGWASPRLKDAELTIDQCAPLYTELVLAVRTLFHQCRLVHADLSEYNILYHAQHLWIIDVSQSVEQDHPAAFDFLRNDLRNVEDFFARRGVRCLGLRRAFEFVTRDQLPDEDEDGAGGVLARWLAEDVSMEGGDEQDQGGDAQEDAVFLKSYIPRSLNEVYDPERDVAVLRRGDASGLIYADTLGLVAPLDAAEPRVRFADGRDYKGDDSDGESSDADEDGDRDADADPQESSDDDEPPGFEERKPRGHRHEDPDAKKERKKAVKAEAKEKRKNKMPKAEKKRRIKKGKS